MTSSIEAPGATVLVVDDEEAIRRVASVLLMRRGFTVITASDGDEAIAIVRGEAACDAVLLDLTMPRTNGIETWQAIRRLQPELPVVLTSGYSRQYCAADNDLTGIGGFIQKPFDAAELIGTMRTLVARRRGVATDR